MSATIDFFFMFGSTYSYLTILRIEDAAAKEGITLNWRPFNVREIMVEMDNIPFRTKPVKAQYMWRDIERRAGRYGLPFAAAPDYPIDGAELVNRVGVLAAEQGWCPEFAKAAYQAWFLENVPLGDPGRLSKIISAVNKDPDEVLTLANSDRIHAKLDEETDAARKLGIFGAPTFVVDQEIFWGDDRLEDAMAWRKAG